MSEHVTEQEVKKIVRAEIETYERTAKSRWDSLFKHLTEMYGNGSGTPGFMETAHKENLERFKKVIAYVDTQLALEEAEKLAEKTRDKKLNRLLVYAKIGGALIVAFNGKTLLTQLVHWALHLPR